MVARIAGALALRNLKNVVETVTVEVGDTVEVPNIRIVRRHRLTVRADRFELDWRGRDLCSGLFRHGE